jgi:hypothetical protein
MGQHKFWPHAWGVMCCVVALLLLLLVKERCALPHFSGTELCYGSEVVGSPIPGFSWLLKAPPRTALPILNCCNNFGEVVNVLL